MRLITREANLNLNDANLNLNIQNLGKDATIGERHFGLYKDLVLIMGKVREKIQGSSFYYNCDCKVL